MAVKDYIDTNDFTKEELLDMIELARSMKTMISEDTPAGAQGPDLAIFQQVSTRTRISRDGHDRLRVTRSSAWQYPAPAGRDLEDTARVMVWSTS